MRSSHSLDRLDTAFDDDRLVADAGLLLPATLARRLGLRELVDEHLDLGRAAGGANAGDKLLTLVMSALAGGDCIDDADALRAGGTARVLGHAVKAPSTLATSLDQDTSGGEAADGWIRPPLPELGLISGPGPRGEAYPGSTDDLGLTACRNDESGALLNWEDGVGRQPSSPTEEHLIDAIIAQPRPPRHSVR